MIVPPGDMAAATAAIEQLGLTAAALGSLPTVAMHDADVPRIAMYSSWAGTTRRRSAGCVSPSTSSASRTT